MAASVTDSIIMRRGTRVTAGSPTSIPVPGRVTVPTPGPPVMRRPEPASGSRETVAQISAPWVASGSSPPSLMTEQVTLVPSSEGWQR